MSSTFASQQENRDNLHANELGEKESTKLGIGKHDSSFGWALLAGNGEKPT